MSTAAGVSAAPIVDGSAAASSGVPAPSPAFLLFRARALQILEQKREERRIRLAALEAEEERQETDNFLSGLQDPVKINANNEPKLSRKTITFAGSIALLINNVTGGSMVIFPQTYQMAGWLITTVALFAIASLSSLCALMIIEAMTLVPGNHKFQKRLEYTSLTKIYLHKYLYYGSQLFFQLSLSAQNISMIIQSVQVMDFTIVALAGTDCYLPSFTPSFGFGCLAKDEIKNDDISPFGDMYLVPLGWFVIAALVIPLGFINLDDNDVVQKGGFAGVILIICAWVGISLSNGFDISRVPPIGSTFDTVMGVVLFNFAIITTIPSWVNEKKTNVSIVKSLNVSMYGGCCLFACLGFFAGGGFEPWTTNQTILDKMYQLGNKISTVTFYLFPACVNLTTIPVNSIMQRYNLQEAGVFGPKMSAFVGVVLPWLVAIPLYTGSGYQLLVNWAGIILNSTVNFIIPPVIYMVALKRDAQRKQEQLIEQRRKNELSEEERNLNDPIVAVIDTYNGKQYDVDIISMKSPDMIAAPYDLPSKASTPIHSVRIKPSKVNTRSKFGLKSRVPTFSKKGSYSEHHKAEDSSHIDADHDPADHDGDPPPYNDVKSHTPVTTIEPSSPIIVAGQRVPPLVNSPSEADLVKHHPTNSSTTVVPQLALPSPEPEEQPAPRAKASMSFQSPSRRHSRKSNHEPVVDRSIPLYDTGLSLPHLPGLMSKKKSKLESRRAARRQRRLKHFREMREVDLASPEEIPPQRPPIPKLVSPFELPPTKTGFERAMRIISYPFLVAFYYTVPHPSQTFFQSHWFMWLLSSLLIIIWTGGLAFMTTWTGSTIAEATGFNAFVFGIIFVGTGLRIPSLISEYHAYRQNNCDLNRVFTNNVWMLCIGLPVPWMLYHIVYDGKAWPMWTGAMSIMALSLFMIVSLVLVMYRAYDWFLVKPVVYVSLTCLVLFVLESIVMDYSLILDLSNGCYT